LTGKNASSAVHAVPNAHGRRYICSEGKFLESGKGII